MRRWTASRSRGRRGTAQKAEPGGYSDTDYTASFAGFAPARNPLFTGVVILDVQRPNHSGTGAAAVFGRIADRVLWRSGEPAGERSAWSVRARESVGSPAGGAAGPRQRCGARKLRRGPGSRRATSLPRG